MYVVRENGWSSANGTRTERSVVSDDLPYGDLDSIYSGTSRSVRPVMVLAVRLTPQY